MDLPGLTRVVAASVHEGRERITAGRWWRMLQAYAQELLLLLMRPPRETPALRGLFKTSLVLTNVRVASPHVGNFPVVSNRQKSLPATQTNRSASALRHFTN